MAEPPETWSSRVEREYEAARTLFRRKPILTVAFLLAVAFYCWHSFFRSEADRRPVKSVDSPIVDNQLGIEWAANHSEAMLSWAASLKYCRDSRSGEKTDWRLPSKRELESIVNPELLDPSPMSRNVPLYGPFARIAKGFLFSGTVNPDDEEAPWIMNIRNGYVFSAHEYEAFAWCVRDLRFSKKQ